MASITGQEVHKYENIFSFNERDMQGKASHLIHIFSSDVLLLEKIVRFEVHNLLYIWYLS